MMIDTGTLAAFMAQRVMAMIDDVTVNTAMTESMAVSATLHAAIEANVARMGVEKTVQWLRLTAREIERDRARYAAAGAARRAAKATPGPKV